MSTNAASSLQQTLSDIVLADSRAAAVFDRLGLDYCCHGHQTLEEAAAAEGVDVDRAVVDLEALGPARPEDRAAGDALELDALTRQIVSRYHQRAREMTVAITAWLDKLVNRHGSRHPELREVQTTFGAIAAELASHMMKEELILFPFIDAMAMSARAHGPLPVSPFGTILNPIRMMEEDHREAGAALERLRSLTGRYTPPEDACTTYRLCYAELAAFEADLHRHVHLENNVLFPRAVEVERSLL